MKLIKPSEKEWLDRQGYSKKIFAEEKGNLVQMLRIKPGDGAPLHHHKILREIFYFLNSGGYFIVNKEKIPIIKGEVLIIEPNEVHTTFNDSNEDLFYICFKTKSAPDDFYLD
jgi:mannose-6-phosphate isomerase-like protein (cupin superfamily)